jgi:predicted metal-dependent hydrolase
LAKLHGFSHAGIRITSATTRWGSCSSKKTLNFSYRLIMSPKESIDYVIIHELCHLRQMNHSARFWREVASIMPNYKIPEDHLKKQWWMYRL